MFDLQGTGREKKKTLQSQAGIGVTFTREILDQGEIVSNLNDLPGSLVSPIVSKHFIGVC